MSADAQHFAEEPSYVSANAADLQERDAFTGIGWTKVLAPAKVNLHLAIGDKRADGYHEAVSVMHSLALHDVLYMRPIADVTDADLPVRLRMVSCGDVVVPEVPTEKNLAAKAVRALARAIREKGRECAVVPVEMRLEKNIPAQAGLGGGSSDAAAALAGAARLWGLDLHDPLMVETATALGADVPFFLRGGCVYLTGTGNRFDHELSPRKDTVVLVKPSGGVSTKEAYDAFDACPMPLDADAAERVRTVADARRIKPFNNLAPAAEKLMPELEQIRAWLLAHDGVEDALLCGSGSATFALCGTFSDACAIASEARTQGLWARTTTFSPLGVAVC